MPGSILGELVTELIVKPIFEVTCYATGKPIVRLLSGGRLHTGAWEPDRRGRRDHRWYSLTFTRGGKRYADPHVVALLGMIFWIGVIGGIVLAVLF